MEIIAFPLYFSDLVSGGCEVIWEVVTRKGPQESNVLLVSTIRLLHRLVLASLESRRNESGVYVFLPKITLKTAIAKWSQL